MPEARLSLPSLKLPVALLRFWPGEGSDRRARSLADELFSLPGVIKLDERLYAFRPIDGRGTVFDTAVLSSLAWLSRLGSGPTGEDVPGLLILPAEVIQHGEAIVLMRDALIEDLDRRRPHLPQRQIITTGYAASWLHGRYDLEKMDLYAGPSGRRVPLFQLRGPKQHALPWHNPKLLGRKVMVERPTTAAALAAMEEPGAYLIKGPLGVGKTHAVWHHLAPRQGPKIWLDIGRVLSSQPILATRLAEQLHRLVPRAVPAAALELLAEAPPAQTAESLIEWMEAAVREINGPLWVVFDDVQIAGREDFELLAHLATQPVPCHLILIRRNGMSGEDPFAELPQIEIPVMDEAEGAAHARELIEGLALDPDIEARWLVAAAGFPLALEEGLVGLVHRGLIRQVYGSFFYDGSDDVEYKPSHRLVRHVEAEIQRFGEPLPWRILALAGQAITPSHLELTCARFDVRPADGWFEPLLAADLLRWADSPWGRGLVYQCPAYARALAGTVTFEAASSLRRALGLVIAKEPKNPEKGWATYRLLAGTPEALPSLLDLSRDSGNQATRAELFEALVREYRQSRSRGGQQTEELDILWSMLPLGRRLGQLGELEDELDRAILLSSGQPKRQIALLTLKAEHDQERGRFNDAEKALRRALAASSEASRENERAMLFVRLGDLLKRTDRLTEAREVFESLLEVVDRNDLTSIGATCHFHLGNIALREMRLEEAMEHHQKAVEVRREKQLFKPLGASLTALGAVVMAIGDYSKALRYYREAQEVISKHGGDPEELGFAHLGSGRALGHLGNHTEAAKLLRRAFEARNGRDDVVGEAIARLDLAANQLNLGKTAKALKEARQAHFQLSLVPETSLLGDAEQLLGRILLQQRQESDARLHLAEAQRIHRQHDDRTAAAIDSSWLLELALQRGDKEAIVNHSESLEILLKDLPYPPAGEMLYFRLYRAFDWLMQRKIGITKREPLKYLRRAYRELMRKTAFLAPELRHSFLYQIREHQEVVDAAAEHNLSLPGV
ncbi:MAG: tetratricopeptide repeat protein [Acidobacteriota bacterium]